MSKLPHLLIEGMITSSVCAGGQHKRTSTFVGELLYVLRILEQAYCRSLRGWPAGQEHSWAQATTLTCSCTRVVGPTFAARKPLYLESLEGKRGNPRNKPPFPAVQGLYARPTVVNNVESIAAVVPVIVNDGWR